MKLVMFVVRGLVLCFFIGPVHAYQYEVGLQHENFSLDSSRDSSEGFTTKTNSLTAEYYFSDVQAQDHPLALAAFFEKSSSVDFSFLQKAYDDQANPDAIASADMQYYLPGETFFVGATYVHGFGHSFRNGDIYGILAGVSPQPNLEISALYATDTENYDTYIVQGRYVWEFNSQALQLQAGGSRSNDEVRNWNGAFVDAAFYFNKSTSLGARYGHETGLAKNDNYLIYGQYFFSDNLNVMFGYGVEKLAFKSSATSYEGSIVFRF